jgi:murein DD-endopeptidase MepM/ murein hydrolase activator NlpD
LTTPSGLDRAAAIAADRGLLFRFPLDASSIDETPCYAWFGELNEVDDVRRYHAAEDYRWPAGTPVYAIADGRVSYSGPAGGYGWMVIVDHPRINLCSLYGHLSPSRWSRKPGPVSMGALLGYLGDPDENGGSPESPLDPHLHFGARTGQRADYSGRGEWRSMAGWIGLCPQDLGWLQPSLVITTGAVPAEGFPAPDPGSLVTWGVESLIALAYSAAGTGILAVAVRRKQRFFLFPGVVLIAAGIASSTGTTF